MMKPADASVVICGLAHQCALTLPLTLRKVERLRGAFAESAVVVFENESRDRTLSILERWAVRHQNVAILSGPFPRFPESSHPGQVRYRKQFSRSRIERMAWARNQYLDFVKANHKPDFVIVLDFDLWRIDVPGVLSSFRDDLQWDAVFSNSRAFSRNAFWRERVYWDTYAFKPTGDYEPQTVTQIRDSQQHLMGLRPGDPWLPVASAFGGLGVYRWAALRDLHYHCEKNPDDEVEVCCEHVTLHRDMAAKGFNQIFINPEQVILYDTLPGGMFRKAKAIIKAALIRLGWITTNLRSL